MTDQEKLIEAMARAICHADGGTIVSAGQSRASREFGWKPDGEHLDLYAKAHWQKFTTAAEFALSAIEAMGAVVVMSGQCSHSGVCKAAQEEPT
jgi:hypothetical protein